MDYINNLSDLTIKDIITFLQPIDKIIFVQCCKRYFNKKSYFLKDEFESSNKFLKKVLKEISSEKRYETLLNHIKYRKCGLGSFNQIIISSLMVQLKYKFQKLFHLEFKGYDKEGQPILTHFKRPLKDFNQNLKFKISINHHNFDETNKNLKVFGTPDNSLDLSILPPQLSSLIINVSNRIVGGSIKLKNLKALAFTDKTYKNTTGLSNLIPNGLEVLELHNQNIESQLPNSIKSIRLEKIPKSINVNYLPQYLESLVVPNAAITDDYLPPTLKELDCYSVLKYPLCLESLKISNPPIGIPFPTTLTSLDLTECNNTKINYDYLSNLTTLSLYNFVNQSLPTSLKKLKIKNPLDRTLIFPDNILYLDLGGIHTQMTKIKYPTYLIGLKLRSTYGWINQKEIVLPKNVNLKLYKVMDIASNATRYLAKNKISFVLKGSQYNNKKVSIRFLGKDGDAQDDRVLFLIHDYYIGGVTNFSTITKVNIPYSTTSGFQGNDRHTYMNAILRKLNIYNRPENIY